MKKNKIIIALAIILSSISGVLNARNNPDATLSPRENGPTVWLGAVSDEEYHSDPID